MRTTRTRRKEYKVVVAVVVVIQGRKERVGRKLKSGSCNLSHLLS